MATTGNRFERVRVRGARVHGDISAAFVTGSINLPTTGPMQLTMQFVDEDLDLLAAGLFARGAAVSYDDLAFSVRAVEVAEGEAAPVVTVTCYGRGWIRLSKQLGQRGWKRTSVAAVARGLARAAGMKHLVQPSPTRRTIVRKKKRERVAVSVKREKRESSVSMLNRYGGELGYLLCERSNSMIYGTPRWVLGRGTRRSVNYNRNTGAAAGFGDPTGLPTLRRAEDSPRGVATLEAEFVGRDADRWRSGDAIVLTGVPSFGGAFLVENVTIPLNADPVRVSASIPQSLKTRSGDRPPAVEPAYKGRVPSKPATLQPPVADLLAAVALLEPRARPDDNDGDDAAAADFDGAELVAYAAARAGVDLDGTPAQIRRLCASRELSVGFAALTRGALLFRKNEVGIVVARGRVLAPAGRGYLRRSIDDSWTSAALVPGVKYPAMRPR